MWWLPLLPDEQMLNAGLVINTVEAINDGSLWNWMCCAQCWLSYLLWLSQCRDIGVPVALELLQDGNNKGSWWSFCFWQWCCGKPFVGWGLLCWLLSWCCQVVNGQQDNGVAVAAVLSLLRKLWFLVWEEVFVELAICTIGMYDACGWRTAKAKCSPFLKFSCYLCNLTTSTNLGGYGTTCFWGRHQASSTVCWDVTVLNICSWSYAFSCPL